MLRNEVQDKTNLSRKAIEYYEEKGLIHPIKLENGYRDYSDEDVEVLKKISLLRNLELSISEIALYLDSKEEALASILRRKEHELDIFEKRKNVLKLIVKGESVDLINEELAIIEAQETIYDKLIRIFPGYFGQLIFSSYKIFLNESLNKDEEAAFNEYIKFLDSLPNFELSKEEKDYIETISSSFDMKTLDDLNKGKLIAIENSKTWLEENEDYIKVYKEYKNTDEYKNGLMKSIQDKLKKFMQENNYYEKAIPLIRKFSKSYDAYYEKLLKANEEYLKFNK
ncbi:MerR family transcriptional regulator [Fenollaria timonensis]|uniref:MerR family transcriptional regulator n=1 Tax=Fenollaria timonensis TaxID=1723384 RepID=UPI00071C2D13|nr:MerR family transcriptional regulator [Fenollaria timonensis]